MNDPQPPATDPATEGRMPEAKAQLRRAVRKQKDWTTKVRRAKTYLSRYRGQELEARAALRRMGVDPDPIVDEVLGDYTVARPEAIDLHTGGDDE